MIKQLYYWLYMDTDRVTGVEFPQETGGSKREVQGGNFPCILISTHFLKLSLCINYKHFNFFLTVSKTQSLNTCKRVGVKIHFI
jgi:hypothetical protein